MTDSVTITDNRTGESIEIPIDNGGVDARQWSKLLPGTWFFDPSFSTTAAAESAITELDGENGILRYRGYPIEDLAENSTYLEVAYLLIHGELPTQTQFDEWVHEITYHTFIHENVRKRFMEGFHHDAHPMGILVSTLAALSTFYPDAKNIFDPDSRHKQIIRLIAKMPTIAAGAHRHSVGMPFVYPDNSLDFCSNFLSMMWKVAEPHYQPDPVLVRALEVLFILHADHEQNCSTTAMRVVGSAHADPYSAAAAATSALYGPRHGGANETPHDAGILSMARTNDPNSAGSQFFICLSREGTRSLDNQYTVFGKTADQASLDIVKAIGAVKTNHSDRPLKEIKINSARVIATTKPL